MPRFHKAIPTGKQNTMMKSPPPPPPSPPVLHQSAAPNRNNGINPSTPNTPDQTKTATNNETTITTTTTTTTTTPIQTPPPSSSFTSPSPSKSASRFKFHSDTKAPTELSKIEQQNAQIITAFRTRLNSIDKQIALWNAKFSTEVVDRDRDMVGMLDYVCVDPLERSGEMFLHRLNDQIEGLWGIHPDIIEEADNHDDGADIGDDDYDDGNSDDGHGQNRNGRGGPMNSNGININHGQGHDQNGGRQGDGVTLNTSTVTSASASASATATETNTAVTTLEEIGTSKDDSQEDRNSTNALSTEDEFKNDNGDDHEDLQSSTATTNPPSIRSISRDMSTLSSNLNYHIHTCTPSSIQTNLLNFQSQVQNNIPSHIQMEKFKSSKREQSIHHKIDSMAGITQKSLSEERATAHAELTILKEKVLEAGGWDELRTARFLSEVREIRESLRREREERMKKDEFVLNRIVETRELLHKTLLDSLGKE